MSLDKSGQKVVVPDGWAAELLDSFEDDLSAHEECKGEGCEGCGFTGIDPKERATDE